MEWRNVYRGVIMGICDLIPGVSGGTVAVMLGIYRRFIAALNGLFSSDWKQHLGFLVPLGVGIVFAMFALSNVIEWLLEYHPQPTHFFFLGLIIGILPILLSIAQPRRTFTVRHYALLIAAAIGVASFRFVQPDDSAMIIHDISTTSALGLFFSGWLASMAMILPGISGSFVLIVLGVYPTAIYALSNWHIMLILIIGSGVILGFIVSSKAIQYIFRRYPHLTYALIIGLVLGSTLVVYPGFGTGQLFPSVLTFVAGFSTTLLLSKK